MALIRTLADMRCIIRREEVVKWVINDVTQTQDALALEMLHVFTKRIMRRDSEEKPADVFERILQQVSSVRLNATKAAEAAEAAKAAGKAKKKKKKKARTKVATDVPSTSKPPTNRRAQNQPQGTHQTAKAGPSNGDAKQAAKEPTTAEKGATMLQAYDAL